MPQATCGFKVLPARRRCRRLTPTEGSWAAPILWLMTPPPHSGHLPALRAYRIHTSCSLMVAPNLMAWKRASPMRMTFGPGLP